MVEGVEVGEGAEGVSCLGRERVRLRGKSEGR